MGQLVTTIVGGIGGFLIGGPMGAAIGMQLGGMAGSMLFAPTIEGPRMSDLNVSVSTYGNAIPRVFGTARVPTNMIWTGGIKEKKEKKSAGGGKGAPKQTVYTYSASFAVAVSAGPVDAMLRIWADGKLISDSTAPPFEITPGQPSMQIILNLIKSQSKSKKYKCTFYRGSEDQLPCPIIEAVEGAGNVPAHRGLAYLVFENMPLEDFGNRIPQITVEVTKAPIKQIPYLHIRNDDDSFVTGGDHYLNYESDRWIVASGNTVSHFSLSTHQLVHKGTIEWGPFPSKVSISDDGEHFIYQQEAGNARPFARVSTRGGTPFVRGRSGNIFDEYFVRRCGGTEDDPIWMGNGQSLCVGPYFVNASAFDGGSVNTIGGLSMVTLADPGGRLIRLGTFHGSSGGKTSYTYGNYRLTAGRFVMKVTQINQGAAAGKPQLLPTGDCSAGYRYEPAPDYANVFGVGEIDISLGADQLNEVFYDQSDNCIIVFYRAAGNYHAAKISLTERAIKWHSHNLPVYFAPSSGLARNTRLAGGTLCWAGSYPPRAYEIDLTSGAIVRDTQLSGTGFAQGGWDDTTKSLFAYYYSYGGAPGGTGWCRIMFTTAPGEITVGSIVSEILNDTGMLLPDDYDVSQLTDKVTGYVISREATARDCIQQLASAYFFDGVESDYKIKFVKRGGDPKLTILEDQMGNVAERDTQFSETLGQESEAPMRITINYLDKDRDYQTGSQFDKRRTGPFATTNSRLEAKTEYPIVMTATEAKRIANKALMMTWANRTSGEAKLPWRFLKYDPSDVVTIALNDGSSRNVRIAKMDIGADLTLKLGTVSETPAAYTSLVIADPGRGGVPIQDTGFYPPATLEVINTPLLRDRDDTGGSGTVTYYAAYSITNRYGGGYVSVQTPTDMGFNDLTNIVSQATAGRVAEALPKTSAWNALDTTTTLTVTLYNPDEELESITYEELMAGGNPALVGSEIIQYQNAVLNDNGTWTLSNILRGRRGTNPWIGSHKVDERFIVLDEAIENVITQNLAADVNYRYRITPPGQLSEDQRITETKQSPNDLRSYTVEAVKVTSTPEAVTIKGNYRSRLTRPLMDAPIPIAFSEGSGGYYEVTAFDTMTLDRCRALMETNNGTLDGAPLLIIEEALSHKAGHNILSDGYVQDLSIDFPPEQIGDDCLLRIVVYGFNGAVRGFPKFVHAARVNDHEWDLTELW